MGFERLPNHIGVKILHYLPIDNQVRIAKVNRRFQELSTMAISKTTELNLRDLAFMEDADLDQLVRLCAANLKIITVSGEFGFRGAILEWPYPRLVELILCDSGIDAETVRQLLINCPNIRRLRVESEVFPAGNSGNTSAVTCGNVESLEIRRCSENVVNFCIDACASLKRLHLSQLPWSSSSVLNFLPWNQLVERLNEIIGKYPDIEQLTLGSGHRARPMPIGGLSSVWRLSSLRSLSLFWLFSVNDQESSQINQLSQLEELTIVFEGDCVNGLTGQVIFPFSGLKNLRQLTLCFGTNSAIHLISFDQGISSLSGHQRLEYINVNFKLSADTVVDLAHTCPQLKRLVTHNIVDISKRKAKKFVWRLHGFIQEKLTIEFARRYEKIWQSDTVESALSMINAASNGRSISIQVSPGAWKRYPY